VVYRHAVCGGLKGKEIREREGKNTPRAVLPIERKT